MQNCNTLFSFFLKKFLILFEKQQWNKIVWNCLEIKGIYGREMFETWYKMMSMLRSGLNIERILTHKFSFADYEKGFAVMNSGQCGKVVLDWTQAAGEVTV